MHIPCELKLSSTKAKGKPIKSHSSPTCVALKNMLGSTYSLAQPEHICWPSEARHQLNCLWICWVSKFDSVHRCAASDTKREAAWICMLTVHERHRWIVAGPWAGLLALRRCLCSSDLALIHNSSNVDQSHRLFDVLSHASTDLSPP